MTSLRQGFGHFVDAAPHRLHVAAHSHHPWPDVSLAAQQAAWHDAVTMMDGKWEHVLGEVLPETQRWIADRLGLLEPDDVAVAPNTHELVMRILSCLEPPVRILTTDGEFASFERQVRRLAEDGLVSVRRVASAPLSTCGERLAAAAADGGYDLLFFSHVLFGTGAVIDVPTVVAAVPDRTSFVVVDGYHGFMALPTTLGHLADRIFYLAGGYKYAMAGEGVCFAHCPPGYGDRPRDTGWYAAFDTLEAGVDQRIGYGPAGRRFLGATFDPTALYRFNAVQRWLADQRVEVAAIHAHVRRLQRRFLAAVADRPTLLGAGRPLAAPRDGTEHGHLLAFAVDDAPAVAATLAARDVVVDHRRGHVRVGFGIYHDDDDVDRLIERL